MTRHMPPSPEAACQWHALARALEPDHRERITVMAIGPGSYHGVRADHRVADRRKPRTGIHPPKVGMVRQKTPHDVNAFFSKRRTYTENESATTTKMARRSCHDGELAGRVARDVRGFPSPLDFGMTTDYPQGGARRIDEDGIETPRP